MLQVMNACNKSDFHNNRRSGNAIASAIQDLFKVGKGGKGTIEVPF